jgi:serine/threonine-protein kinase
MRRCLTCASEYPNDLAFCPKDGAPLTTASRAAVGTEPTLGVSTGSVAPLSSPRSQAPYMTPPRADGIAPTAIAAIAATTPQPASLSVPSSTGAGGLPSRPPSAAGRATGGASPATATSPLELGPQSVELVGQVIGERYRVVRKLGEGGMGEVFECHHVYIEKRVALKLLRREILSNAEAVTRFHQEARAASSIGHRNIVDIDDFGHLTDGRVYLAMEYLDGESLADLMRRGMELPRALRIMEQVCRGLEAAHAKGIVHRDMKPENVFLARLEGGEDLVKILDFGIAKVAGTDGSGSNLTRTGTIFGTPNYMSPEQALGRALDPRSDIYSVGIILYELFVGVVPFRAESFMGILSLHITAQPVPPRVQAPERHISADIERIILRAIDKEPSQRFGTMGELADALHALAGGLAGDALERTAPRTDRSSSRSGPAQSAATPNDRLQDDELEDEAPPPRRASLWLTVLAMVAVAVGVIAWKATGRRATPAASETAPTAGGRHPAAPQLPPTVAPDVEPASAQSAPLMVSSAPPGADVYHQRRLMGHTPLLVELPTAAGGRPHATDLRRLRFTLPGYTDAEVEVGPHQTKLHVTLEPVAAAPADPTPPRDGGKDGRAPAAREPSPRNGRSTPRTVPTPAPGPTAPTQGPELYERLDSLPPP